MVVDTFIFQYHASVFYLHTQRKVWDNMELGLVFNVKSSGRWKQQSYQCGKKGKISRIYYVESPSSYLLSLWRAPLGT